MDQEIIKNYQITERQLAAAIEDIKNGEGLYVVACCLGLDHLPVKKQDWLIDKLGIFAEAQQ
jgi:hypothetical protein